MKDKIITIEDIMALKPCYDPVECGHLPAGWSGTLHDLLNNTEAAPEDIQWVVLRLVDDKTNRLFAVKCARRALSRIDNPDPRSIAACDVAERYAYDQATVEQLREAYDAAYAVAYAAAANAGYAANYTADADYDAAYAAYDAAYAAYTAAANAAYAANAADYAANAAYDAAGYAAAYTAAANAAYAANYTADADYDAAYAAVGQRERTSQLQLYRDLIEPMGQEVSDTSGGTKHDADKPRMELLCPTALTRTARVLTDGANKYDDHNWRKGFNWSRLYGAALRHLTAHMGGQDNDPESGRSHLDHLACCVMFLQTHEEEGLGNDDRYKQRDLDNETDGQLREDDYPGKCD